MRRGLAQRRVLATGLALMWALVPLASVLHSDGHGHRYCAEHRAFEEDVTGSEQARRLLNGDVIAAGAEEAADGHSRCPVAHPGSRDATPVGVTSARISQAGDTGAGVRAAPVPAPIDVLARAPKSSPPSLLG